MFVPVPSPKEMAVWDAEAIKLGIPEDVLMENAARAALAVLEEVQRENARSGLRGAKVLLVMGGGNNGGDAACLARHLKDAGAFPVLVKGKAREGEGKAARLQEELARKCGVDVEILGETEANIDVMGAWGKIFPNSFPDIIIDGLLGTGFSGALRPRESTIIAQINALAQRGKCCVLALDVPSGLDAHTAKAAENTVRAGTTVCFQAAKPGLVVPESAPWVGKLVVRPIGIPRRVMEENPASARLWLCPWQRESGASVTAVASEIARNALDIDNTAVAYSVEVTPDLPPHHRTCAPKNVGPAHKGAAGKVLIIGGSRGMSGAPRLGARGALRGGAGLVTVAAPAAEMPAMLDMAELLTIALPESQGCEWSAEHVTLLAPALASHGAVVIGPGMGRNNGAEDFLHALLLLPDRPSLILDADALCALASRLDLLSLLQSHDILTPHPGEAASLLKTSSAAIQADRFAALRGLQSLAPAIWVLKGAGTLIGTPPSLPLLSPRTHLPISPFSPPLTLCPWNVPTLAVAGSGDVLAGLIGALVAQKYSPSHAASLGVFCHALAGVHLLRDFPLRGNSPQDIADALPFAHFWL